MSQPQAIGAQLVLPGLRAADLSRARVAVPPCLLCRLRRCHLCRVDPEGGRLASAFWLPFCWGTIDGPEDRHRCTCWPETARQRRLREEARGRQLVADVRANMRRWNESVKLHRQLEAGQPAAVRAFLNGDLPPLEVSMAPFKVLREGSTA